VAIVSRVLFVLLTLRLLMPPGICVCHLADTVGRAAPSPENGGDDHHPGCPASYLSLGLGLKPLPGPGPVELPPCGWQSPSSPVPASAPSPPPPVARALAHESPPLHVVYCAFLI
jgi:hypothetical protein